MFRTWWLLLSNRKSRPASQRPGSTRPRTGRPQVEPLEERQLLSTFTVLTTNDSGPASLRQAILSANANPGLDNIFFKIGSGGVQTITPTSELPTITDPVVIDGTTQPGFAGTPLIELNGGRQVAGVNGLTITAGSSRVQGLVINRFPFLGILISGRGATGNVVQGNFIGTDVTGTQDLGNGETGVGITFAPNNTIGGTAAGTRNVISGNSSGIVIGGSGATGNRVQGNFIGTDVTGTKLLGNTNSGVVINGASSNTIGGTTAAARNVISGNREGIFLVETTANVVQGNFIGTDVSGTRDLGNTQDGVVFYLAASGNTIGGTASGAGNTIAFNGRVGVLALPQGGASTTGNTIRGNALFANASLGIDLGLDGVTPNDPGDGDGGVNQLQNFPVLTSATQAGGSTTIAGRLNSTANATFRLDFYVTDVVDPSAFGEGRFFLGSTAVTTNSAGNAGFTFVSAVALGAGRSVSATATDAAGNTSEFAQNVVVVAAGTAPPAAPSTEADDSSAQHSLIARLADTFQEAILLDPDALGGSSVDGISSLIRSTGDGLTGGKRVETFFQLVGDRDVDTRERDLFLPTFGKRAGEAGFSWSFDFDWDGGEEEGPFRRRHIP
jgi:hypothetical protein